MSTDTSKFFVTRPPRPMLSRDADSMYWMSRYVERAEHVARVLLVNSNLLIDVGDLAPTLLRQQWYSILTTFRLEVPKEWQESRNGSEAGIGSKVASYMTFDEKNHNSLINCVSRA